MSDNPFKEIRKNLEDGTPPRATPTTIPIDDGGPECDICKGKRWVTLNKPGDEDDGKSFTCECQKKRWHESLIRQSEIFPGDMDQTFENFTPRKGTEDAVSAARMLSTGTLLLVLLCGNTGSGKTHLAISCAIESINRNEPVLFIRVQDWLDDLKKAFGRDRNSGNVDIEADIIMNRVNEVKFLVMDELKWRDTASGFDIDAIDKLINHRLARGKATIITSNTSPKDLRDHFPRVISRASDPRNARTVWIQASDYRPEARNE